MRIAPHHPGKQQLFALLTLADLSLTWWLLSDSRIEIYESNPLARWWLDHHGWLGLAGFKAATALLVIAAVTLICRRRPDVGGRVLAFGCVVLAAVVLYSSSLCVASLRSPRERDTAGADAHAEDLDAADELRKREEYRALRGEVGEGLIAGRLTLRDAVGRLAASELGRDPDWLRALAFCYYDRPADQCLAADLIRHAVETQSEDPRLRQQLVQWLGREFALTFGRRLPPRVGTLPPWERPEEESDGHGPDPLPADFPAETDGPATCARRALDPPGSGPPPGFTYAL